MKKYLVIGNPIEQACHQSYIIIGLKKKVKKFFKKTIRRKGYTKFEYKNEK